MPISGGQSAFDYAASVASGDLRDYPIKHGSDIYTYNSMTGLAHSPLDDIDSYILGVVTDGTPPPPGDPQEIPQFSVDPDRLTREFNSAGSVVFDRDTMRFQPYIYAPSDREWIAYLPDTDGCLTLNAMHENLDRVYSPNGNLLYTLAGDNWVAQYLDADGKPKPWPDAIPTDAQVIPAGRLIVVPNGRGLLYWGQKLFWRLEEIAETERTQMTGPNLVPVFTGDIPDRVTATMTLRTAQHAAFFPGDVRIDRVVSTALVEMLKSWYDARRQDWLNGLHAIDLETVQRPVAAYGSQQMMSLLRYANRIRSKLKEFYSVNFGETIGFDRIITLSGDELAKQIAALQMLRSDLGEDWYMQQISMLSTM